MQIEVLPVPTEPEIRTVFPRGMPPFRMWSIAAMPVTHRSRSSSECSVAGIDSVVTTRRAIFEVTALSIRSESRCCRTSPRIRTVAPFRRLLSSVDDFERVVPAAGAHPDEHPEGDRGLEPPRGLDPPEVEGPGPAELLHDADDGLLRRGVISADHQVGGPSRELGIDHLGIRHRVEGLDHPGAGEGPLDPLSEGIRHPDERDEIRVIRQRIRHVDHDLPVEAGVADALQDLLDGRAAGREDDELALLGRLFEAPGRGLPFHRSKPLRQALALWIPRADHYL